MSPPCNFLPSPELPHKLDVLKEHCASLGRDQIEIEKTTLSSATLTIGDPGSAKPVLEAIEYQASLGIDQVILNFGNLSDPAIVEMAAKEILEPARSMSTTGR